MQLGLMAYVYNEKLWAATCFLLSSRVNYTNLT